MRLPDFGDYVRIEMFQHGCENEFYVHKVIGNLRSNAYVNVPITYGRNGTGHDEIIHDEVRDVLRVVQCGPCETKIFKVAASDVESTNDASFA